MGKLLTHYRSCISGALPCNRERAMREARLAVYKALFPRWGAARVGRHMPAIIAVLDRAYEEVA